jgi:hypothetical protein
MSKDNKSDVRACVPRRRVAESGGMSHVPKGLGASQRALDSVYALGYTQ